jgi:hypothetical protein
MANLTKMSELPGLDKHHKTHTMENIMTLMDVIQEKLNLMVGVFNCKQKASIAPSDDHGDVSPLLS